MVFLGHNEMEITIPINYFSAPDNVANFQVLANPLSLYKMRITFTVWLLKVSPIEAIRSYTVRGL